MSVPQNTTKRSNKLQLPTTIWINLTNLKNKEFIFYDSIDVKFMNKQKQFMTFGVRMVATVRGWVTGRGDSPPIFQMVKLRPQTQEPLAKIS